MNAIYVQLYFISMKKILFQKLLKDCLIFFVISIMCTSVIIWVFQAVNFLDIIIEDGRDSLVYIKYSLLNFPKIISKIIPFAVFFSFYYVLLRYENNNELMIFWNFGVHKIEIVNFFFKFSFLLMLLQQVLTIFIVPETQSYSRYLLKNSSIDFFEGFIKPKKFNDNIKGLTIYADEKDEFGNLKNIYLKKDQSNTGTKYQITVAKKGNFVTKGASKILILYNGQTLNLIDNKITNFNFSKSEFSLSELDTDVIITEKIQETSTHDHINCIKKYFTVDLKKVQNPKPFFEGNCQLKNLQTIFQEIYKRFFIPLYIPVLILCSLLLILKSKENNYFNKFKFLIFLIGIGIIIISESSLKFINDTIYSNFQIILLPIIIIFSLYLYFLSKLKFFQKK